MTAAGLTVIAATGIELDTTVTTIAITDNTGAVSNTVIRESNGLDIAASNVDGNLTVTVTAGNLTDSGTVTVGGTGSFTTSTANADIDLGTLAVTGSIDLHTNGATGNASVVNATVLDLATSAVGG